MGMGATSSEFSCELDVSACEVAALLLREVWNTHKWVTYGTGYAVLRLGDEAKFHVWADAFCAPGSDLGGVHTHRWHLASTVLLGRIETATLREVEGGEYLAQGCGCGIGPAMSPRACGLVEVQRAQAKAGHTYTSSIGSIHRVVGFSSPTLTFVRKRGRRAEDDATFFELAGRTSVNPYTTPRKLTLDDRLVVADAVRAALRRWVG